MKILQLMLAIPVMLITAAIWMLADLVGPLHEWAADVIWRDYN